MCDQRPCPFSGSKEKKNQISQKVVINKSVLDLKPDGDFISEVLRLRLWASLTATKFCFDRRADIQGVAPGAESINI